MFQHPGKQQQQKNTIPSPSRELDDWFFSSAFCLSIATQISQIFWLTMLTRYGLDVTIEHCWSYCPIPLRLVTLVKNCRHFVRKVGRKFLDIYVKDTIVRIKSFQICLYLTGRIQIAYICCCAFFIHTNGF